MPKVSDTKYKDANHSPDVIEQRCRRMLTEHPELRDLIMEDAQANAWFNAWVRTDMTTTKGLVMLVQILKEVKDEFIDAYEHELKTRPPTAFESVFKIKP